MSTQQPRTGRHDETEAWDPEEFRGVMLSTVQAHDSSAPPPAPPASPRTSPLQRPRVLPRGA
jgi:hypothetical protein